MVRPKGKKHLSKNFSDYETAFLWGKYQEMIIKELDDFDVRPKDLYTLKDIIAAKYGEGDRIISELEIYFSDYMVKYLREFSYEVMRKHAERLLKTPIKRGGCRKNGTGKEKLPSVVTIIRKYAYLSSAINHMIKKGEELDNDAMKVIAWLKELQKEKNGSTRKPDRSESNDTSRCEEFAQ